MFGYIMINEQELRMREIALYRSYYCGLCEDLLESYGYAGQLSLSYDTAFLAFLLTSLYEPAAERVTETVCLVHPFRKHPMRRNDYTRYAADLTVLLSRQACLDDWTDEHKLRGLVFSKVLESAWKKAQKRLPEKAAAIEESLARLHAIETRDTSAPGSCPPSPDEAGACFGELMGTLFACHHDEWEEPLRHMGFYLGKYIYLLDAYDDLDKDARSGSFNPLLPVRSRMEADSGDFDGYVRSLLTMLMASCCRAFEALPIVENIDILRNVLYAGVWIRFEDIYARRTKAPEPDTAESVAEESVVKESIAEESAEESDVKESTVKESDVKESDVKGPAEER